MKTLGNRVFVKRGESFTLKFGDNEEYAPLVITPFYKYPFITLTIQSMKYPQEGKYKNVRWLDCKNVPKFHEREIMYLGVGNFNNIQIPEDDIGPDENGIYKRLYSFKWIADSDKSYFYHGSNVQYDYREYNFKFKVNYFTKETKEMVDFEYDCILKLIDGETTANLLFDLCDKYDLELTDKNIMNALQALININAIELETLDLNEPLSDLTDILPLYQFKLYVEV